MAMKSFFLLISSFLFIGVVISSDPDILTDFIAPPNVDGTFFTFNGTRALVGADPPTTLKVLKVSKAEFPAVDGQSVSYAAIQYPAGGINPLHTHPRSAELLLVVSGVLEVGFIDTTNKLFTQTLQLGDVFIFPKGLVHFQNNPNPNSPALAISAFGSASAGTVSLPPTLFTTGIDDGVLAKSFKTDVATIEALKAGLAPKPPKP